MTEGREAMEPQGLGRMGALVEVWAVLGRTVEHEQSSSICALGSSSRSTAASARSRSSEHRAASSHRRRSSLIVALACGFGRSRPGADAVPDLNLTPRVEIGRAHIPMGEVLDWQPGAFFSLLTGPDAPLPLIRGGLTLAHGLLVIEKSVSTSWSCADDEAATPP